MKYLFLEKAGFTLSHLYLVGMAHIHGNQWYQSEIMVYQSTLKSSNSYRGCHNQILPREREVD